MQSVYYPKIRREAALPVYVTGVGINCLQDDTKEQTGGPHMILTSGGRGKVEVGGKEYELTAGCVVFIGGGESFTLKPLSQKWTISWLTYGCGAAFGDELFTSGKSALIRIRSADETLACFRSIHDSLTQDKEYGGFAASAALYSLMISLNRDALEIPEPQRKINASVAAIIEFIETHYSEEISLERLCGIGGGLSEQYLCRVFKQATGMRPMEYILKKRIGAAKELLEKTVMPIPEIVQQTGFHNTSYFYRNFKKFTGTSPQNFRQSAVRERSKA